MSDTLIQQILSIRQSGKCNMFDVPSVQREAYIRDYYELVVFLEERRDRYVHFILTGDRD